MRLRRGFTLVEVLVALAVFALVGMAAVQLLRFAIDAEARSGDRAARLEAVQRAMLLLERDLLQALPRSVRGSEGESLPALAGSATVGLEFTRGGWSNPLGLRRSELQRVAWGLAGEDLVRTWWPALDRADEDGARLQQVLTGVTGFSVAFLDNEGESHPTWPPLALDADLLGGVLEGSAGATVQLPYPLAVEIRLAVPPFGELRRFWPLVQPVSLAAAGGEDAGDGDQDGDDPADDDQDDGNDEDRDLQPGERTE